ncbi:MAG: bifunctional demethylmenaquinone methyltransferase/2-methoxy-6-polyprenyl-1,4-benzoquinol methylase UbiE [Deltaproteobacteria bacterium]|nr:bifunctional demethylmenaquinone methyltransferase/2-methoxy-6-polyprenyl-1,4-benzoquinol methylase UbiE [Deltaproteobacteria bacterium]
MTDDNEKKFTLFGNRVVPVEEKETLVKGVFDSVADKYDLMNDLMSLFTHRVWKRILAAETGLKPGERAIDVAGGTADIALLMAARAGAHGRIVVYDINAQMLKAGRAKCIDRGFLKNIRYVQGNAEEISFEDNAFHCATVGFGIRNVTHLDRAFAEMTRVVKPGGKVICLEFSRVNNALLGKLYDLYSFNVIPEIGRVVTGNRGAYAYLAESIRKFPPQEELKKIMEDAGLYKVRYTNVFGGVAAMHVGVKV